MSHGADHKFRGPSAHEVGILGDLTDREEILDVNHQSAGANASQRLLELLTEHHGAIDDRGIRQAPGCSTKPCTDNPVTMRNLPALRMSQSSLADM